MRLNLDGVTPFSLWSAREIDEAQAPGDPGHREIAFEESDARAFVPGMDGETARVTNSLGARAREAPHDDCSNFHEITAIRHAHFAVKLVKLLQFLTCTDFLFTSDTIRHFAPSTRTSSRRPPARGGFS